MVWEKSVQIDEGIRSNHTSLHAYTDERDRRLPGYFEGIGFCSSNASEWVYDPSYHHPPLFKASRKHLFFLICTQHVLKVEKGLAEKMLVLGVP